MVQKNNYCIDGKALARQIEIKLLERKYAKMGKRTNPLTLIILAQGNDLAQQTFIHQKIKVAHRLGISVILKNFLLEEEIQLLETVKYYRQHSESAHGVIVQLPLPKKWNTQAILEYIAPSQDVDCLESVAIGRYMVFLQGAFVPATVKATKYILDYLTMDVSGKNVLIIGQSALVGIPQINYFLHAKATVCSINQYTEPDEMLYLLAKADIVVSATSSPGIFKTSRMKKGSLLIDIGFHFWNKRVVGDAILDKTDHLLAYTPVPGGVGPLSVIGLMENLITAW